MRMPDMVSDTYLKETVDLFVPRLETEHGLSPLLPEILFGSLEQQLLSSFPDPEGGFPLLTNSLLPLPSVHIACIHYHFGIWSNETQRRATCPLPKQRDCLKQVAHP